MAEKANHEETQAEIELAIRRILIMHAIILTIGGIPLIYLGDEIGTVNDYSYRNDPDKARDSRWVHRPYANEQNYERRTDPDCVEGRIFQGLQRLIRLRRSELAFSGSEMQIIQTGNEHVFGYMRIHDSERVLVFANFSEAAQSISANLLRLYGLSYEYEDLLEGKPLENQAINLAPYQFVSLKAGTNDPKNGEIGQPPIF